MLLLSSGNCFLLLGGDVLFLFLKENRDWNKLIQDAHKRGAIIKTSEESYRKDAVKILKLRPAVRPRTPAGTNVPPLLQAVSSSSRRGELATPSLVSSPRGLAAGAGHAVPQGSRGPPQLQGAQATDARKSSASAPVEPAVLPAAQEKPRDPRLASMASRTEMKGKEQALKHSGRPAQSKPGSASQQGLDVSSAASGQISRAETCMKPLQMMRQCDMPSTSPYAAQHEGGLRAAALSSSRAHSEGGQGDSGVLNKDCHVSTRRMPESMESSSAKRRKTSH